MKFGAGGLCFSTRSLLAIGTPAIVIRLDQGYHLWGSDLKLSHHRNPRLHEFQGHHSRGLPPLPITLHRWLPPCHSLQYPPS